MNRLFDPEAIRIQIANLVADRDRITRTIETLEAALRTIEKMDSPQTELAFDPSMPDITLHDAVRRVCTIMMDGITRQRVIKAIEDQYAALKPKSASVAASLVNLTKGENPVLRVAIEGTGRSPSFYSTNGDLVVPLSGEEIAELVDEKATHGTGGWQSLWSALLKKFDKATGKITLTPELRARIYRYYREYGQGGWQTRVKRVFRRELPHLFA